MGREKTGTVRVVMFTSEWEDQGIPAKEPSSQDKIILPAEKEETKWLIQGRETTFISSLNVP